MWNPNIKVIHITKLVQMIFNAWFGYFQYVDCLPRGVTLILLNLLFWFDRYQLQLVYPTVQHRPARNLQHKASQTTFDMFDQSQHLLHTLHKSFLCFTCVFTFLEIIKHNMLKMLFSPIFSIKMTIQKFTSFDKFFLKCMLIWQLSQYKLTKLFWMKLKTSKRY